MHGRRCFALLWAMDAWGLDTALHDRGVGWDQLGLGGGLSGFFSPTFLFISSSLVSVVPWVDLVGLGLVGFRLNGARACA